MKGHDCHGLLWLRCDTERLYIACLTCKQTQEVSESEAEAFVKTLTGQSEAFSRRTLASFRALRRMNGKPKRGKSLRQLLQDPL